MVERRRSIAGRLTLSASLAFVLLQSTIGQTAPRSRANPAYPSSPADWQALGNEIVDKVRAHFYDKPRAQTWADAHRDYGGAATDRAFFAQLTRAALAELRTSHTGYYERDTVEHIGLAAIFQKPLKLRNVTYDSIGVDLETGAEGVFVRHVFAAGPAERAGLMRGDEIVTADGKAFDAFASFKDRSGRAARPVQLQVRRVRGGPIFDAAVTPERINPKQEWLRAQRAGTHMVQRRGKLIAYQPFFSCAGSEHRELLEDSMQDQFFDGADALVLDFRDGWGGCNPDFVDLFNPYRPRFKKKPTGWHKPAVLLVNGRTRSGKETVTALAKQHKFATVVGERTAGAVIFGRPIPLSNGAILYIAVEEALVNNVRLEGVGVEPDYAVADSLPYAAGRDPQREKALDIASRL